MSAKFLVGCIELAALGRPHGFCSTPFQMFLSASLEEVTAVCNGAIRFWYSSFSFSVLSLKCCEVFKSWILFIDNFANYNCSFVLLCTCRCYIYMYV